MPLATRQRKKEFRLFFRSLIAALLVVFINGPSFAERLIRLNGQRLEVSGSLGEKTLSIGGTKLIEDWDIELLQVARINGTKAVVGQTSSGGNACAEAHFIVAYVDNKISLFSPQTCDKTTYSIKSDQIVIATEARPTVDAQTWVWTPENGLRTGGEVAFEQSTHLRWDDLSSQNIDHPYDLFYFADIKTAIDARLARYPDYERERFAKLIQGLGSGRYQERFFSGTACLKNSCEEDKALIFLDDISRTVFLAWTTSGGDITHAPPKTEWSLKGREVLENWQDD